MNEGVREDDESNSWMEFMAREQTGGKREEGRGQEHGGLVA